MGAGTNTKGYGGLLFFDSLVEKADVSVYLSDTRMSPTLAQKRVIPLQFRMPSAQCLLSLLQPG